MDLQQVLNTTMGICPDYQRVVLSVENENVSRKTHADIYVYFLLHTNKVITNQERTGEHGVSIRAVRATVGRYVVGVRFYSW